jgi:hypothetical protein
MIKVSLKLSKDEEYVVNLLSTYTTYACQLTHYKDLYFVQFPYLNDDEDLDEAFEEVSKLFIDCGIHVKRLTSVYHTPILFKLTPKELESFVLINKRKGA